MHQELPKFLIAFWYNLGPPNLLQFHFVRGRSRSLGGSKSLPKTATTGKALFGFIKTPPHFCQAIFHRRSGSRGVGESGSRGVGESGSRRHGGRGLCESCRPSSRNAKREGGASRRSRLGSHLPGCRKTRVGRVWEKIGARVIFLCKLQTAHYGGSLHLIVLGNC